MAKRLEALRAPKSASNGAGPRRPRARSCMDGGSWLVGGGEQPGLFFLIISANLY